MPTLISEVLGRRIRRIRHEKGLTLKQIEGRVKVSATHISEIERGKTSPTIGALEKIARALEVLPSHLIDLPPNPEVEILRPDAHRSLAMNDGAVRLEPLTNRSSCSEMSLFLATIEGSGTVGDFSGHRGEEFCFVLDGFLEVSVNGKPYVLRKGDSIHFKAAHPHQIRNLSSEPVRTLWAIRPKLYL